jgi:hypothetical protein
VTTDNWTDFARRAAFASHQLIGWIYWDPRAAQRHADLGVKVGLGHYIANRAAPRAAAGVDAVTAAFGSIDRFLIHFSLDLAASATTWDKVYAARMTNRLPRRALAGCDLGAAETEELRARGTQRRGSIRRLPVTTIGRTAFGARKRGSF